MGKTSNLLLFAGVLLVGVFCLSAVSGNTTFSDGNILRLQVGATCGYTGYSSSNTCEKSTDDTCSSQSGSACASTEWSSNCTSRTTYSTTGEKCGDKITKDADCQNYSVGHCTYTEEEPDQCQSGDVESTNNECPGDRRAKDGC